MKEYLFKNATITFIIMNVWTLFLFFNYLLEEPGLFRGLGTLGLYIYSLVFGILIGIITLLLRILIFRKAKSEKLKTNFFYLFAGVFNLTLFITWLTLVLLKILEVRQGEIQNAAICNGILSLLLLADLFIVKGITKPERNMETKAIE
ncbi:hypothetical protein [Flavobacterium lacustre]|uniref:hypothetical protein n=1 Tax=Flavobacterium lacustre TaxID=3016339 RepID=UPI0022B5EA58|nr:hypothetical protein [Flavobacterium lacustre]